MGKMTFGDCKQCDTYKFLEEDHTCPTCLDADDEAWVVVMYIPHIGVPEVYERDLSEKEAKERADDDPWLAAKPERVV